MNTRVSEVAIESEQILHQRRSSFFCDQTSTDQSSVDDHSTSALQPVAASSGIPKRIHTPTLDVMSLETVLKTYFHSNFLQGLATVFLFILFTSAYSVHIAERSLFVDASYRNYIDISDLPKGEILDPALWTPSPFESMNNCIWFTLISFTTGLIFVFVLQ
jgi:hypothetical protein